MDAPIILYGSSILLKHSIEITEGDNVIKITELLSDTLKTGGMAQADPLINVFKRAYVRYQDMSFKTIEEELNGLKARISCINSIILKVFSFLINQIC